MSRRASMRLNDALDRWVPPALRDSWIFARAARSMYGDLPIPIDELKERAFTLSPEEYGDFYRSLQTRFEQGDTDLTPASLDSVVASVLGQSVLDVACGKGYLAFSAGERPPRRRCRRRARDRRPSDTPPRRDPLRGEHRAAALPRRLVRHGRVDAHARARAAPRQRARRAPPSRRQASRRGRAAATPVSGHVQPAHPLLPVRVLASRVDGHRPSLPVRARGGDWLYVEEQTG